MFKNITQSSLVSYNIILIKLTFRKWWVHRILWRLLHCSKRHIQFWGRSSRTLDRQAEHWRQLQWMQWTVNHETSDTKSYKPVCNQAGVLTNRSSESCYAFDEMPLRQTLWEANCWHGSKSIGGASKFVKIVQQYHQNWHILIKLEFY